MSKIALETVPDFQKSMGSETNEWENLIDENITFKGPVDQVSGKEVFIKLNNSFFLW